MIELDVREATVAEKPVLAALLELYQYDFTEFTGADVGDDGRFGFARLDLYWQEAERTAFLARVDGRPAGLALVRRCEALDGNSDVTDMTEFFVMRKYRQQGVGERMATALFGRFPGRWQVREMSNNLPAQAFWRTIIGRHTGGRFEEKPWDDERWRGPVQYFDSSDASADRP